MLKRSSSDDATSSLLDDLLDRLGSALLDMHNSLMPEHARKAADRDYDEVRAAIKAHATRSETREPEGYPGIAHDFETMRAALTHIAYGKWGDHESASSIATRALQSTPSATPTINAAPEANKGSRTGSPVPCPHNGAAPVSATPMPKSNDGREQTEFELWAKRQGYDMQTHPLHWLFLDKRTYAAREGWRSALEYVEKVMCDGYVHGEVKNG